MVVKGKEEAVWSSAGLKISLKSESKNWLEEGGGMCVKTHCISEQVACEKPAVTGSLLCRVPPRALGQSSLRTLFRFSGVCLACGSPSRSHLAFVCLAVQEILCFYFVFFFLHAISSYCTGAEVQRVQFPTAALRSCRATWCLSGHTKTQRQWTQRLIWWIQTHLCVLGHKCGWNVFVLFILCLGTKVLFWKNVDIFQGPVHTLLLSLLSRCLRTANQQLSADTERKNERMKEERLRERKNERAIKERLRGKERQS